MEILYFYQLLVFEVEVTEFSNMQVPMVDIGVVLIMLRIG